MHLRDYADHCTKAPFPNDILKDIFQLIVSTFNGLSDLNNPLFRRSVSVLETLAKYRPFFVLLDRDCDDLMKDIFTTLLTIAWCTFRPARVKGRKFTSGWTARSSRVMHVCMMCRTRHRLHSK